MAPALPDDPGATPQRRMNAAWTTLRIAAGSVSSAGFPPPRIRMRKLPSVILAVALASLISGCGILYKQPIYQGNLIEKSNADQLQAGMSRQQVMGLLGTPSIADPFHHDRWDYTASERSNRRGTVAIKNLTLWFEGDALSKWEGEYFPEQDEALAKKMSRFGNLPKDKKKNGR
jgi:outer membrane protein assembly factor BamE